MGRRGAAGRSRAIPARAGSRAAITQATGCSSPARPGAAGSRAGAIVPRVLRIGVAKEVKTDEYRVALTPAGARELVLKGHDVLVETGAGEGSSWSDDDYVRAGAQVAQV